MLIPLGLFVATLHWTPPAPRVLVGDALPTGAVVRLGPDAFRYAGWVQPLHQGGPTVWYSPDGRRVAVTSTAGVYLWDAATGKRLLWAAAPGRAVTGLLGFHPDGELVVDCRREWDDGGAGVYRIDAATGRITARFIPRDDRRFRAASPDGKVAYSRTRALPGRVETVANEIETGKELWRRKHPEMDWMRVSPDGSRLVVWSSRSGWDAEVLDAATGKTVGRFTNRADYDPNWTGGGLAVGPRAERVVTAHAWNRGFAVFAAGIEKPVLSEEGPWYDNAYLTADARHAVLKRGRAETSVEVWDVVAGKRLSAVKASVRGELALSPGGAELAVAGDYPATGTLAFIDVATGKRPARSPERFDQAAVVWYLPDGTLASANEKLTRPLGWDLATGKAVPLPAGAKPPAPPEPPDGFAPTAGTINVVAAPDGRRAIGYRIDPDELDSSPGDTYLGLFDARGGLLRRFTRPDHTLGAKYAFSPDGKAFALACGDGTIALHGAADGSELRTLRHGGGVTSLAFSPDGRRLATACGDGPVLVWDVAGR